MGDVNGRCEMEVRRMRGVHGRLQWEEVGIEGVNGLC